MILELEYWHLGYQQILNDCRTTGEDGAPGTVFLLCNKDVDAMSCSRILSYMLRSDGIHYQLLPCSSYLALDKYLLETPLQDVRAVILINFGASKNLTTFFDHHEKLNDNVKLYVFDCRRPVHLANIHAGENVVMFWDQTQSNDFPSDGDNLSGNDSSSSDSSSSSSDEDDSQSGDEGEAEFGDDSDAGDAEAGFDDVVRGEAPEVPAFQNNDDGLDQGTDYDGEDERDGGEAGRSFRRRDENDDDSSTQKLKRRKTTSSSHASSPATDGEGATDAEHTDAEHSVQQHGGDGEDDTPNKDGQELSPRELHRQRRDRLHAYYTSGSFYGSPVAYMAYRLANQMRFGENGDLLWLACVGVTDAYLHARLDVAGYHALVVDLRRLCLRLFPNDMYQRAMTAVFAEDLTGDLSRRGDGGRQGNERTKITFSENGRIISEKDYRFFLLRHSSLFDSMAHSDYVSTRLQVWTKRGLHKLQELLAKMGYPLDECHQPFAFMKPSLKRRLQEKIVLHAAEYGLENFEFTSFFRVTGYQSLLSASDTSYAVTALLESNPAASVGVALSADAEEKEAFASFNTAYDALNPNMAPTVGLAGILNEGHDSSSLVNGGNLSGNTGIGAGIRLAMSLQREIISTAVNLVDRNAITRLRHFRYAYITCTSAGENQSHRSNDLVRSLGGPNSKDDENNKSHVFAKPLALNRLAHYLMDMHRENGKWSGAKARPLVLMAEKPRAGTYLVVGYEYPERAGSFVKNKFGKHFHFTSKSMKGTMKFDSFDSNVVEVGANDVQRFIEQLHYLLDSI